ncbi:MAG: glycosyltransferase [Clostridia bacterium]|nr:glycosyltransferase [Clostridia bacterium]
MPKFSIIVPIYNSEDFLNICVDSILAQKYADFELLLVNNNSTDRSVEICKSYCDKDSRVHLLHETKKGVSAARNCGILNAKGEFIVFVDSDDYIRNDYLEVFLNATQIYPEHDNIWCSYQKTGSYKNIDYSPADALSSELYSKLNRNMYMTLAEKYITQPCWNKLYRRDILIENNILMKEGMNLGEDIVFGMQYLDCVKNTEIIYIDKPLYVYVCALKLSLTHIYHINRADFTYTINNSLVSYAYKWNLDEKEIKKAYNSSFYRFESTMRGIVEYDFTISKSERIKSCHKILRSPEFKTTLKKCNCKINILHKLAYKTGFYPFVMFSDMIISKLYKVKHRRNNKQT